MSGSDGGQFDLISSDLEIIVGDIKLQLQLFNKNATLNKFIINIVQQTTLKD